MLKRMVIAFLASSAAGCGPGPTQSPPAETCVQGWWLDRGTACDLACPGQPECSLSDCRLQNFLGLLPTGVSVQGTITIAASSRAWSAWGPPQPDSWSIDANALLKTGASAMPIAFKCDGSSLSLGFVTSDRAESALGVALSEAHSREAWTGRSY